MHWNSTLPKRKSVGVKKARVPYTLRAPSGWLSVAFGAKRKWRYHHSHAPLPAALDLRGAQRCVLHREGRHRAGARVFLFRGGASEARTGVHRFRVLDGWQVADGVTGFGGTTLALSGVMRATSSWSLRLGLSETATLRWDVACLPSGCVDLNVSS